MNEPWDAKVDYLVWRCVSHVHFTAKVICRWDRETRPGLLRSSITAFLAYYIDFVSAAWGGMNGIDQDDIGTDSKPISDNRQSCRDDNGSTLYQLR